MSLAVYTFTFNEAKLFPYFLRHYTQFASKIVVYDNQSTDDTVRLAQDAGCEVRPWDTGGQFGDPHVLKNQCWEESRGVHDLVVVCDSDEILWTPDLTNELQRLRDAGIALPQVSGYQMVSDTFPTTTGQIYDEVKWGARDPVYFDKLIVFDPNVARPNYGVGCHTARPNVPIAPSGLKLLHYKHMGVEYAMERNRKNMARRVGVEGRCLYDWDDQWYEQIHGELKKKAVRVVA